MSRLFQRNGKWYADYSNERRRRVKKLLRGIHTKRDAQVQLAELVSQVRRRELGLEPAAVSVQSTVWALVDWWLTHRCPKPSAEIERQRLEKHLKGTDVGNTLVAHARPAHFEAWFSVLERPIDPKKRALAAGSINHLRAKVRTAFERARREDVFSGRNPMHETKMRKVTHPLRETLAVDEVPVMLAKVPLQWRGFVAAAVYLGLRKGEIAGLRKVDVNLKSMVARVACSYERDTTKGGHGDLLPIPAPMRAHLELAMLSPGPLLFGDELGKMRRRDSKPDIVLRRALKNAELVIGYELSCRWCTHEGRQTAEMVAVRPNPVPKCPFHAKTLWVKAIPRYLRFHDLRHSTATILLRDGMDAHRVQKLMRHRSFDTTSQTYAHLVVEDLRAAQNAAFEPTVPTPSPEPTPTPEHPKEVASK